MTVLSWFIFAICGRTLIFLLQQFPFREFSYLFNDGKLLQKLLECDLCLGFWVYLFLAFWLESSMLPDYPYIGELLTAAITTFLVHVFGVGWRAKFSVVELS